MFGARDFVLAVIPSRYASTRFPGKPLAMILNKPMIQWVYEGVVQTDRVDEVVVATDDQRIVDCVEKFGGRCEMTSSEHPTGTDRVAEVAARHREATIILNIQGDEPMVNAELIEALMQPLLENECDMSTLRTAIHSRENFEDPDIVKVLVDNDDFAFCFSRAPVPFSRNGEHWRAWLHYGFYGFRRESLFLFQQLEPTELELTEGLEPLRVLQHGFRIKCPAVESDAIEVDRPEDIQRVESRLRSLRNKIKV